MTRPLPPRGCRAAARALLVLGALACSAADCDPGPGPSPVWGGAPTDVCAAEPVAGLLACPLGAGFPYGQALRGSFDSWQPGEVRFTTTSGDAWRVELHGGVEAFYGVPDLRAQGTLQLAIEGFCDIDDGPQTVMLAWQDGLEPDAGGALLLLAGNTQPTEAAGWAVHAPRDAEACADLAQGCDCWESCRSKPVLFTGTEAEARLHQREETVRGDLVLRVSEAWSGLGTGSCGEASTETQVWAIFRR